MHGLSPLYRNTTPTNVIYAGDNIGHSVCAGFVIEGMLK